jgi:hypothetical protein
MSSAIQEAIAMLASFGVEEGDVVEGLRDIDAAYTKLVESQKPDNGNLPDPADVGERGLSTLSRVEEREQLDQLDASTLAKYINELNEVLYNCHARGLDCYVGVTTNGAYRPRLQLNGYVARRVRL